MEGSITENLRSQNQKPSTENVVNEATARKYGVFTFTISTQIIPPMSMEEFGKNFPTQDVFEELLQGQLEQWTKRQDQEEDFWLNKPA